MILQSKYVNIDLRICNVFGLKHIEVKPMGW